MSITEQAANNKICVGVSFTAFSPLGGGPLCPHKKKKVEASDLQELYLKRDSNTAVFPLILWKLEEYPFYSALPNDCFFTPAKYIFKSIITRNNRLEAFCKNVLTFCKIHRKYLFSKVPGLSLTKNNFIAGILLILWHYWEQPLYRKHVRAVSKPQHLIRVTIHD